MITMSEEKDVWKKTADELTDEDIKAIHDKATSGKAKRAQDGSYVFFGHDEYDVTQASKKRLFMSLDGVTVFDYDVMVRTFTKYAKKKGATIVDKPTPVRKGVKFGCDVEVDPEEFAELFEKAKSGFFYKMKKKKAGNDGFKQVQLV